MELLERGPLLLELSRLLGEANEGRGRFVFVSSGLPMVLGQELHEHQTLPLYKLHVWLWRDNPREIFADWNPKVSCQHAAETDFFE